MHNYKYTSLNNKGKTVKGTLSAANEIDLEHKLKTLDLQLLDCKIIKERHWQFFDNIKPQDIILLCIQLEKLEQAGVPMLDAIGDLRDSAETPALKNILAEIYEAVNSGIILSAALKNYPKIFDNVFVGLIAAGEKTGQLSKVFAYLAAHIKWSEQIKSKIKKASYYPIFLLILMSGIISLMMINVIPQLSQFLTSQNFALPWYSQLLIKLSKWFQKYWWLVFGLPTLSVIIIKILINLFENIRHIRDKLVLSLPFFGSIIRKIELARFCRFFMITFKSGIGILDCLNIASNVLNNTVLQESVRYARQQISEGSSLTNAFRATNQFPSLVIRMIKVGEDSGSLDSSLEHVNYFYDQEVEEAISSLIATIQPVLTIVMGGLMLWVALAVFGPLYTSFSKMNF